MSPFVKMSQVLQAVLAASGNHIGSALEPALMRTPSPAINWTDCSPNPSTQLRCANFSVPLDWNQPDGQQINLALGMIPAANETQRIGYLMMNPGGPGGTPLGPKGTGDLGLGSNGEYWRSSQLHQYFDIVGPDPRGIGLSSPLECDPEVWNTAAHISLYPDDEDSYNELVDAWKAAGKSCLEKSGELLNHVDTASVAKDFEAIRLALGNEPMNFLGFSYGTQVGAQYAELYPDQIRAMVLDGNLDHSQEEFYWLETESAGFEATLKSFFTWCESNSTCALRNIPNLPTAFDKFIDAANQNPVPMAECNNSSFRRYPCPPTMNGYDILAILQVYLCFPYTPNGYNFPGFAGTAEMLQTIMLENDASAIAAPNITTLTNADYGYTAVICQDWNQGPLSWPDYQIKMRMASIISPHTRGQGEIWRLQARCMNWPVPVVNPPHSIAPSFENRTLKTPVLLVNAFWDPETAYPWAVSLQRQFGENGVLLSRNGSGHTSWYHKGETHYAINDYLIALNVPEPATILPS